MIVENFLPHGKTLADYESEIRSFDEATRRFDMMPLEEWTNNQHPVLPTWVAQTKREWEMCCSALELRRMLVRKISAEAIKSVDDPSQLRLMLKTISPTKWDGTPSKLDRAKRQFHENSVRAHNEPILEKIRRAK